MNKSFLAVWYDTEKVLAKARLAGWKDGEDGLLDVYNPEEDADAEDVKSFPALDAAVDFLKPMCAEEGKLFWRQANVREYEIGGTRCKYCTCKGHRLVHEYVIEDEGIVEDYFRDNCAYDEG